MDPRFATWLEERADRFYRAVWRRYGEDGLDAMQTCLLKGALLRFKDIDHTENFMWKCVKHKLLVILRGRKRRSRREILVAKPESTLPKGDPELEPIDACVQELSPTERQIYYAILVARKSFAEAAVDTGVNENTLKTKVYRDLVPKLRRCLERRGISFSDMIEI